MMRTWQKRGWMFALLWGTLGFGESPAQAAKPVVASDVMLASLQVPQGFTVERAAGPPLVERPMLATFDDQGRLYVADSAGVNLRGAELSKNPPHVIRRLEDTDGDGRFDKSIVFADKLVFPQGLVWHRGAIYCSSPPSFWKLTDSDGDGVCDQREELVTGFANTGVADDMHGGSLGPDGYIYWCAGRFPHNIRRPGGPVVHRGTAPLVLRCRPDGSELEVVCGSQGNAVGVAFTPEGDMFASGTFLAPNSMGAGLRDALVHCVDGGEYPVRDRTLNEHKRTGDLLPPLTHLGVAAASDLTIYRGAGWGDAYRGNLFSALFNMHKVTRHKLERSGATFVCRNEDFLVSSHTDFHPTDVFEDADGSLLVIDTGGWFRIGCPTSQVEKPEVLGGIYRVRKVDAPRPIDPRGSRLAWDSMPWAELIALLGDPRFEVSDRAIEELARRGKASVEPLQKFLAAAPSSVSSDPAGNEARTAAIWALTRIDDDTARAAVRDRLNDPQPGVRQAAARSAGIHRDTRALDALMDRTATDRPEIVREAATALGRMRDPRALPALFTGLNFASDRFQEHALIFALIRIGDSKQTLNGLQIASSPVRRGALIALDQMDNGPLTPEVVTPFLSAGDPLLHQTALWVIGHHGEWGRSMVSFFEKWLSAQDADAQRREELVRQLVAFAGDSAVQELMGRTLGDSQSSPETRLMLLDAMAKAPVARLPKSWSEPLKLVLADKDERLARQAVAALRALPLSRRPLVTRVDKQIDYPETSGKFAGTRLSEDFFVRWTGVIRCPQDVEYVFHTESDDGSRLFVDRKLVVDNSGSHAMRDRQGKVRLTTGDHEFRVEFVQGGGEAGCRVSWEFADRSPAIIPAEAFWHRNSGASPDSSLSPGLITEFYEIGAGLETIPDVAGSEFDGPLVAVALDEQRPLELRVAAASAVTGRLESVEPALFELLRKAVGQQNAPLVRIESADALGRSRLDSAQLTALCGVIAAAGVLEVPKLLTAFEDGHDAAVGRALLAALARSPGLKSVPEARLGATLASYDDDVRAAARPLLAQLHVDNSQQKARLAELQDVLTGGDIQRGRELFFANQKAICATCHAVQGQGGRVGPDLTKIGAIRAPADLLEAIVFPSVSFARGYEPFTVQTDSGQVFSGLITRETAEAIYLVDTARVETGIPRSEIESLVASTVSIMPAGMDAQLSRQELADLIAFLHSLR